MAQKVYEAGRKALKGTTAENTANYTPFSIDAAVALVSKVPTAATRTVGNLAAAAASLPKHQSGILEATIVIEGTQAIRYRKDNVDPSTTVGHLISAPASATAPITLVVKGADEIAGFRMIGAAAGNTATVSFDVVDI